MNSNSGLSADIDLRQKPPSAESFTLRSAISALSLNAGPASFTASASKRRGSSIRSAALLIDKITGFENVKGGHRHHDIYSNHAARHRLLFH